MQNPVQNATFLDIKLQYNTDVVKENWTKVATNCSEDIKFTINDITFSTLTPCISKKGHWRNYVYRNFLSYFWMYYISLQIVTSIQRHHCVYHTYRTKYGRPLLVEHPVHFDNNKERGPPEAFYQTTKL